MKIEIISDTICPWCFIGKRRFERALELRPQPDVEVTWHPYQLNPDMPVAGMDRQTFLAARSGGAARAGRRPEVIAAAGRGQGIDFRFDLIPRTPNTLASHRLVHLVGGQILQQLEGSWTGNLQLGERCQVEHAGPLSRGPVLGGNDRGPVTRLPA